MLVYFISRIYCYKNDNIDMIWLYDSYFVHNVSVYNNILFLSHICMYVVQPTTLKHTGHIFVICLKNSFIFPLYAWSNEKKNENGKSHPNSSQLSCSLWFLALNARNLRRDFVSVNMDIYFVARNL